MKTNKCNQIKLAGSVGAHLIDVYVVVVRRVVDGFEEALKLARGASVHHQDERYPHWFEWKALGRVLVPLDVHIGFTFADTEKCLCVYVHHSFTHLHVTRRCTDSPSATRSAAVCACLITKAHLLCIC